MRLSSPRLVAAVVALGAVGWWPGAAGAGSTGSTGSAGSARGGSTRFVAGFSADTPTRVRKAAAAGITTDILYDGPPKPSSALGKALSKAHMKVVDARLSGELFYWECHRTHTVAPPPKGQRNDYCRTDEEPSVDSQAMVLKRIERWLRGDAHNRLVSGYWVLDDWPYWDGGSARGLLQRVHREIVAVTPHRPAICGFGGTVLKPGRPGGFGLTTAKNYSNAGCDMVGWYNYSSPRTKPSDGAGLDWRMKRLLATEKRDLARFGWRESRTPLLGIGQAWASRYERRYYEPGLTVAEIVEQARAFCAFGARSIGWYGWDDSGYVKQTKTPDNSAVIVKGIERGAAACGF